MNTFDTYIDTYPNVERFGLIALKAHYLYGNHSGIPQCCNIAWCKWVLDKNNVLAPRCKLANYRPCQACYEKISKGLIEPVTIFICNEASVHKYQVTHRCNTGRRFDWWLEFASSNVFKGWDEILERIKSGK